MFIIIISPCKHTLCVLIRSAPGASNEYQQHMFAWRNKKIYNLDIQVIQSYVRDDIFTIQYRENEEGKVSKHIKTQVLCVKF